MRGKLKKKNYPLYSINCDEEFHIYFINLLFLLVEVNIYLNISRNI